MTFSLVIGWAKDSFKKLCVVNSDKCCQDLEGEKTVNPTNVEIDIDSARATLVEA